MENFIVTEILRCLRTNGCMKWRNWQSILNNRQIAADIEEKLANKGKVLRGGISRIYFSMSNEWKPYHGTINSRHVISERHWKSTFDFSGIVNKLRVEARSSIANCEIYFPIFSQTMHTILKIFSRHGLRKRRLRLL